MAAGFRRNGLGAALALAFTLGMVNAVMADNEWADNELADNELADNELADNESTPDTEPLVLRVYSDYV